jgi:hypothetical protein
MTFKRPNCVYLALLYDYKSFISNFYIFNSQFYSSLKLTFFLNNFGIKLDNVLSSA